jgi:DNA (cytosine-5-)-methyltransferase
MFHVGYSGLLSLNMRIRKIGYLVLAKDNNQMSFRYIDLCAGIGGFHQAMKLLGGVCVGAAEVNDSCIRTYQANFPTTVMLGDITDKNIQCNIPTFDLVCAGFPCQPFSKAGKQLGFEDKSRGKLFFSILDIIDAHPEAKGFIFENVRNLADNKKNWSIICDELKKRDFIITEDPLILSPSDFGIPQKRERVFILGIRQRDRDQRALPNSRITEDDLDLYKKSCGSKAAFSILDKNTDGAFVVTPNVEEALFAWDEFRSKTGIKTIGFPIWLSHFGIGINRDSNFFEMMGIDQMPTWKQNYLKHNRHFYQLHRHFIDDWIIRYHMLDRSKLLQKFEWNCGTDVSDIKHGLIQIRQSGVRVKRPDLFPTLVAMPNTPIVWDGGMGHFRRITPKEAAKLQSFDLDYRFNESDNQTYRQLGNAVNVEIARQLGRGLLRLMRKE